MSRFCVMGFDSQWAAQCGEPFVDALYDTEAEAKAAAIKMASKYPLATIIASEPEVSDTAGERIVFTIARNHLLNR